MRIFLDDIRMPSMSHNSNKGLGDNKDWIIVRDYFEFINIIDSDFDSIELISFDHDLACYRDDREFTGKDAANYIIDYCIEKNKKFPSWYVHSDNTSGKKNIIGIILNYLKVIEGLNISEFRYYHNGILNGVAI